MANPKRAQVPQTYYSPDELAERWVVDVGRVREWIESGGLTAINVASAGDAQPDYRVGILEISLFEKRRRVHEPRPSSVGGVE
jgi:hypothetical protein